MGGETRQVRLTTGQRQHGIAARRMSNRPDAWTDGVPTDTIAPLGIAQQRIDDVRDVLRPLGEVARRALLHQ